MGGGTVVGIYIPIPGWSPAIDGSAHYVTSTGFPTVGEGNFSLIPLQTSLNKMSFKNVSSSLQKCRTLKGLSHQIFSVPFFGKNRVTVGIGTGTSTDFWNFSVAPFFYSYF